MKWLTRTDIMLRQEEVRRINNDIRNNPMSLRYASVKPLNTCKLAVSLNGLALEFVPNGMRNLEICEIAVGNDPSALSFVPEELLPHFEGLHSSLDTYEDTCCFCNEVKELVDGEHCSECLAYFERASQPQVIAICTCTCGTTVNIHEDFIGYCTKCDRPISII